MKRFSDKVVFVTGGARGIGLAIAERFAGEGADLCIGDLNIKLAEESAAKIENDFGVKCMAFKLDVNDCSSINTVFADAYEANGRLDVLINNAGIQIRNPSKVFNEKDWDLLLGVNLKGAFFCTQAAVKYMNSGAAVVNVSSGTSTQTTPGRAPYVISKAAVNAMTAVLGAEWASEGIRVNAVAPGWILTDMVKEGIKKGVVSERQVFSAVPIKRFATPYEIADALVYLASDQASYITGQTLFVDGGWSALGMPDLDD